MAATSYNTYYNTSFQPFSSSNVTQSIYNYNYTNASNAYNVSDQSGTKQYNPPVSYMGNSMNSVQFTAASAQQPQYSTSSGANSYTNLHYVNANVGPLMQNQGQYKNSKTHCAEFPELDNMTNEELKKLGEDEDLQDEFLEKHTKLKELDSAVEDAIDWVEKTAGEYFCCLYNNLVPLTVIRIPVAAIIQHICPEFFEICNFYVLISLWLWWFGTQIQNC